MRNELQIQQQELSKTDEHEARQKKRGQARAAITELIRNQPKGIHLTANEVFDRLKESGLDVSLSSVYRTLGSLKSDGAVTVLSGERGVRYEAHDAEHDHDHLICLECNYTIEFVDDLLSGFGQSLARQSGYDYKRSQFDIYGLCQECQSKSAEHKIRKTMASLQELQEQILKAGDLIYTALSHFETRKIESGCESVETLVQLFELLQEELHACTKQLPTAGTAAATKKRAASQPKVSQASLGNQR